MDHPNVVSLKHCFFSTTSKNELFLNLVMEYVPETMFRILKHYSNMKQRMPLIYVKLYTYQVSGVFPCKLYVCTFIFLLHDNEDIVADFQRLGLHALCRWGVPQRLEASKCPGMHYKIFEVMIWVRVGRLFIDIICCCIG